MNTNLINLKSSIIGLAAEGRSLRHYARKATKDNRHSLKESAKATGTHARAHLIVMALLKGKHPALVESVHTRQAVPLGLVDTYLDQYHQFRPRNEGESHADWFRARDEERNSLLQMARFWDHAIVLANLQPSLRALTKYKAQTAWLDVLRERHGEDSKCFDRLLDRMDETWKLLTEEDIASLQTKEAA